MTFSIKQKLIISLIVAVLAAAILVGSISQWIARDLVKENMEELQLPSLLKQVGNRVDREASVMLTVAHGIASNPDILLGHRQAQIALANAVSLAIYLISLNLTI